MRFATLVSKPEVRLPETGKRSAEHPTRTPCEANISELEARLPEKGMRSSGRVVEGARLESVYTATPYRGFESLLLRHLVLAIPDI